MGETDFVQKEAISNWLAFCTSLQGTMITSSVFQPHTEALSSFSRDNKLTQEVVLNGAIRLNIYPDLAIIHDELNCQYIFHTLQT
jgi:hypothetical protein